MARALRNFWLNLRRRWARPTPPPGPKPLGPPRVDFSYTIYWTKLVRKWEAPHRAEIAAALGPVLTQPTFETNAYERRYRVPGLDDQAHAGASLVALDKVLRAFNDAPNKES